MRRVQERPDFSFSADPDNPAAEDLEDLLEQHEIADMFDAVIRQRFGEMIAQAALGTRRGS
jgi:hypothetical protein